MGLKVFRSNFLSYLFWDPNSQCIRKGYGNSYIFNVEKFFPSLYYTIFKLPVFI